VFILDANGHFVLTIIGAAPNVLEKSRPKQFAAMTGDQAETCRKVGELQPIINGRTGMAIDKPGDTSPAPTANEKSSSVARLRSLANAVSAESPSTPTSAATQTASFTYIDRPELTETFADSITGLYFDGQSLRIEFTVSRMDEIKPNTPVTGRRYPACRLVLPPGAAVELINKMQQVGAALTKAGVVKQSEPTKA
jgi:hypothetical protein